MKPTLPSSFCSVGAVQVIYEALIGVMEEEGNDCTTDIKPL
ncbi:hypothetical protein [Rhodoflexus sp.]